MSVGRNLVHKARYIRYVQAVARQVYQEYKVVLVDDCSDDGTVGLLRSYLAQQEYSALASRVIIVENTQRMYALYSRYLAITQYCGAHDIVVELDSDDELIGSYVFATINAIYSANP